MHGWGVVYFRIVTPELRNLNDGYKIEQWRTHTIPFNMIMGKMVDDC